MSVSELVLELDESLNSSVIPSTALQFQLPAACAARHVPFVSTPSELVGLTRRFLSVSDSSRQTFEGLVNAVAGASLGQKALVHK